MLLPKRHDTIDADAIIFIADDAFLLLLMIADYLYYDDMPLANMPVRLPCCR